LWFVVVVIAAVVVTVVVLRWIIHVLSGDDFDFILILLYDISMYSNSTLYGHFLATAPKLASRHLQGMKGMSTVLTSYPVIIMLLLPVVKMELFDCGMYVHIKKFHSLVLSNITMIHLPTQVDTPPLPVARVAVYCFVDIVTVVFWYMMCLVTRRHRPLPSTKPMMDTFRVLVCHLMEMLYVPDLGTSR
jgi:hypothetical protein